MTDIDFLREELETLEGQIELIEEYKKFKGDPEYDEFAKERGLTEWINNLSPLETSLGIRFLKKMPEEFGKDSNYNILTL